MRSAATLKPNQANGYRVNSTQKPNGDRTRKPSVGPPIIPTVWDDHKEESDQHQKLNMLAAGVERMASVFEEEKRCRDEQRRIMDLLHKHTMEQIKYARKFMEETMAEMARKIEEFAAKWDNALDDTKEELLAILREKVAAMSASIDALEERSQKLQVGLDEEKAARKREIEEKVRPIWKAVAKLIDRLGREERIRRRRQQEMQKELDDGVDFLNNSVDILKANREQKQKDMFEDNEYEFRRLVNRQKKMEISTSEKIEEPIADLDNEISHREFIQNGMVSEVTSFIQRFQENVREEGES
jgi:hypothetical protein